MLREGGGGAPQPIFSIRENAALHFESNGVMNGGFTEVHALRASAPFSALHGGFVSRWVWWKFRPPYTRTDSQIAAPACIFAYMEGGGKERKWKKVWDEDRRRGRNVWAENAATWDERVRELRRIVDGENMVISRHAKTDKCHLLGGFIFKTTRMILDIVALSVFLLVLSKCNFTGLNWK